MIEILIVCSGGLTSSMLKKKLVAAAQNKKLSWEFHNADINRGIETGKEYDVVLIAPQVGFSQQQVCKQTEGKTTVILLSKEEYFGTDPEKIITRIGESLDNDTVCKIKMVFVSNDKTSSIAVEVMNNLRQQSQHNKCNVEIIAQNMAELLLDYDSFDLAVMDETISMDKQLTDVQNLIPTVVLPAYYYFNNDSLNYVLDKFRKKETKK